MKISEKQKNLIITMSAGKIKDHLWDIKYHAIGHGQSEGDKYHKGKMDKYEGIVHDYASLIEFVIKGDDL